MKKVDDNQSLDVVDLQNQVVARIKPHTTPFFGTYWYCYTGLPPEKDSTTPVRENIPLLLSLSNAGTKVYFIVLATLNEFGGTTSEILLSLTEAQKILQKMQERLEDSDTSTKFSISKNTFYDGIKELVRIDLLKRIGANKYKVNANYLHSGRDQKPERW